MFVIKIIIKQERILVGGILRACCILGIPGPMSKGWLSNTWTYLHHIEHLVPGDSHACKADGLMRPTPPSMDKTSLANKSGVSALPARRLGWYVLAVRIVVLGYDADSLFTVRVHLEQETCVTGKSPLKTQRLKHLHPSFPAIHKVDHFDILVNCKNYMDLVNSHLNFNSKSWQM